MNDPVIFWDFDGTLIHSNQSFLCSLQDALRSFGVSPAAEQCHDFLKQYCSWNRPENSYSDTVGEYWWCTLLDKVSLFCQELDISQEICPFICEDFRKRIIRFPYIAYPDSHEILAYTKEKGYRNYILSNNFPELPSVAQRLGLDPFLDGYFLSSCIGYEKPRVEIFQYAIRNTGCPSHCFMVGDNPIADIEGARAAGISTIWMHPNTGTCKADSVCHTLDEIRCIL